MQTRSLFPQPSSVGGGDNSSPGYGRKLCSSWQRCEAVRAPGRCHSHQRELWWLEAATQTPLASLGLRRCRAVLLCNQSFFMQLFLQRCPVRSDYYGGWKTLLFLTAGSRLNGLKRIFRSSCFRKVFKSVVTTAKTVCLCFGHCFSMAVVNGRLSTFPINVVNYLFLFIQAVEQQLSKRFLSMRLGNKIQPVLLEGNTSNHSLLFTQDIYP